MATAPDPTQYTADVEAAKARARAEVFNDFTMVIHVEDEAYKFIAGEVTARQVGLLRDGLGTFIMDPVLDAMSYFDPKLERVALDKAASLIFVARLQAGEKVKFADVAAAITLRTAVWVEWPEGAADLPGEGVFVDPPASSDGTGV